MAHATSSVSKTLNKPLLSQRTASRGVTQLTSLLILATTQVHTSASCQGGYPGKVSGGQTPILHLTNEIPLLWEGCESRQSLLSLLNACLVSELSGATANACNKQLKKEIYLGSQFQRGHSVPGFLALLLASQWQGSGKTRGKPEAEKTIRFTAARKVSVAGTPISPSRACS